MCLCMYVRKYACIGDVHMHMYIDCHHTQDSEWHNT